jgi:predicted RNase H-like HicB family nuclease
MSERSFPVVIQEGEDGKFIASCPVIEGCFSQGDTVTQAAENLREAIALCLEDMAQRGEALPEFSKTFLTEVTV